jgi:threonine dehydrogenase-like Zn-dependent dehydrogenase
MLMAHAVAQAAALGICRTDREIITRNYESAPRRQERLVPGHESLGLVEEAPATNALMRADKRWFAQSITRRVPLEHLVEARRPVDIKALIEFLQ